MRYRTVHGVGTVGRGWAGAVTRELLDAVVTADPSVMDGTIARRTVGTNVTRRSLQALDTGSERMWVRVGGRGASAPAREGLRTGVRRADRGRDERARRGPGRRGVIARARNAGAGFCVGKGCVAADQRSCTLPAATLDGTTGDYIVSVGILYHLGTVIESSPPLPERCEPMAGSPIGRPISARSSVGPRRPVSIHRRPRELVPTLCGVSL